MGMLLTAVEFLYLIFGSLLGAILLCISLWRLLALAHHPEYGAVVVVALTIVALTIVTLAVPLTRSPFVRMLLLFAMTGAIPLWIAGRAWRSRTEDTLAASNSGRPS